MKPVVSCGCRAVAAGITCGYGRLSGSIMAINLEARIERLEMKHAAMERCIQDLTDLKGLLEFYVEIQRMKAEDKVKHGNNRRI